VHLNPYFGEISVDAITCDTIERYAAAKLAESDPLSARSINMTLTLLGAILERAKKRKLIDHNPARDKDLRVKEHGPADPTSTLQARSGRCSTPRASSTRRRRKAASTLSGAR
jgi:hypothetical protein